MVMPLLYSIEIGDVLIEIDKKNRKNANFTNITELILYYSNAPPQTRAYMSIMPNLLQRREISFYTKL